MNANSESKSPKKNSKNSTSSRMALISLPPTSPATRAPNTTPPSTNAYVSVWPTHARGPTRPAGEK